MRWLRQLLGLLGPAGVLGLGVLFFCAPFYLSALEPAERELEARALAARQLRTRTLAQPVSAGGRADELRRFYALFPPVGQLTDEVERLYALARRAKLELQQGAYRLESRDTGLLSYRVTLPIRGTYAQVREFVGAALTEIPIASVDALGFERKKIGGTQIEAQVRLTLHFQPREEPEGR